MAKILVVDDVLLERLNAMTILRAKGHEVIEAKNGKQAIELASTHLPDAIVMDIVMPEMDGFSATKRIAMNPATKHIPIVIVSSKGEMSDRYRATQLGAKGYVVKPVTAATLMAEVDKLI